MIGSRFVRRLARFNESQDHLHEETHRIIQNERSHLKRHGSHLQAAVVEHWRKLAPSAGHSSRSRRHFHDRIHITGKEHMTAVDCFDGAKQRAGEPLDGGDDATEKPSDEDLLVVYPLVDGRLRDEAQN